jgi:hypothetical protein
MDHDHVRSHLRYLLLDASLRSLTDSEHRDDGSDTDDDTKHGEESTQLVVRQCPESYFK